MVFNLTHSQLILRYKENGGRIKPYTIVIIGETTSAITADFGLMEFFFASNKRCLSKNKSGNLICRGFFNIYFNFCELWR
jgi:hypothetical protein